MELPYPFRKKNSKLQGAKNMRDDNIINENLNTILNRRISVGQSRSSITANKHSKRQSLDLSQVNRILEKDDELLTVNSLSKSAQNKIETKSIHRSDNLDNNSKSKRVQDISDQRRQDILKWLPEQKTDYQEEFTEWNINNPFISSVSERDVNNDIPELYIPQNKSISEKAPFNQHL